MVMAFQNLISSIVFLFFLFPPDFLYKLTSDVATPNIVKLHVGMRAGGDFKRLVEPCS